MPTAAQLRYRQRGERFDYRSKEYRAWGLMRQRCMNRRNPSFKYYGAIGITIQKSWVGRGGFANFIQDVGHAPTARHSLDRINSRRGYTKNNCRWATASEQSRNVRSQKLLTFRGEQLTLMEWARRKNLNYHTLYQRLYAYQWSLRRTLTTPTKSAFREEPKQSKEYATWAKIKQRCCNTNDGAYALYGGRGIRMCMRWMQSFDRFLADVGPAPSASHTLDRVDPRKSYSPGNCRWATRKEQASNRRDTVWLEYDGRRMCLMDWARALKMNITTLRCRLKHRTLAGVIAGR